MAATGACLIFPVVKSLFCLVVAGWKTGFLKSSYTSTSEAPMCLSKDEKCPPGSGNGSAVATGEDWWKVRETSV